MPNQQALFEPVEFYRFASWLYSTKPDASADVLKRTIIGRAYYAALLAGSNATGTPTAGHKGHQDVIDAVRRLDSRAGNRLSAMNLARRSADYQMQFVNDRDVMNTLGGARVVLESLGLLNSADPAFTADYLDKNKFLIPCPQPVNLPVPNSP